MSNIVEANYQIVQERTLPVIISEIKIIEQQTAKTVLENGIQIGKRLQEAKEQVGHGNFGQWCEENLNYSQDTAQKFMKLEREYGDENGVLANTATLRFLSISKALSLLKVPEEDRKEFVEEHPVEDMTVKELEEEIRKLKAEKEDAEEEKKSIREIADRAEGEADERRKEVEDLKQKIQDMENNSADPEEIESLKKALEREKARADRQAKRLKEEKEGRDQAVEQEINKRREAIKAEAQKANGEAIEAAQKEKERLEEKVAAMDRKLANAGDESIVKFKILVDQLQDVFDQAGQCILVEPEKEKADKMNAALKRVIEKFLEEL